MKKDPSAFITHILESISLIETYTINMDKAEFMDSTQAQDAVLHRLQIIGEAAKNLPEEIKTLHPDIPWRQITGMRDILVHAYFGVDLELTWATVKSNLPELKTKLIGINQQLQH